MTLAIFDFDGTITTRDSFEDFLFFSNGIVKTVLGLLQNAPALIMYLFGSMANDQAKQQIFAHFYGGWNEEKFRQVARAYVARRLSKLIRPQALAKISWHKEQGHKIVVVSASFENYLHIWCEAEGVELLATRLEIKEGRLTGKFSSKNCYGGEKIERLKAVYNLKDFDFIYAYGDSKGDLPLKEIANEFHYKPFR